MDNAARAAVVVAKRRARQSHFYGSEPEALSTATCLVSHEKYKDIPRDQ